LNVGQDVIAVAESLFFDLRGLRDSQGWMNNHVFGPEIKAGNMDLVARMGVAFAGGPLVTRALLDAEDRLPLDKALRLADQEMLLYAKLKAALEVELNPSSTMKFLELYLDYDLQRTRLQLEQQKFRHASELAGEARTGDEKQQAEVEQSSDASSTDRAADVATPKPSRSVA
jgi:hypothetical protein